MDKFDVKICNTSDKEYLRVDLADLTLLEEIRAYLSNFDCVHHANVSSIGKRKHITVYLQSFYSTKESQSMVENALKEYDESNSAINTQTQELPEIKNEIIMSNSQLDGIPKNALVVFISYSHDNDEHRTWVRRLSDDLRRNGVKTLLDQYEPSGADLTDFMKRGIERADKVIIIGTRKYAQKAKKDKGGAHFEDQIMSSEMFNGIKNKFVPILRDSKGNFDNSFPLLIGTKKGYDFSDDTKYENELKRLINDLNGTEAQSIPPVVNPITKTSVSSTPHVAAKQTSGLSLSDHLKKQLSPYKGEKWLESLLNAFDTYAMDNFIREMPDRFEAIILTSIDMWNKAISASAFTIHDTLLKTKLFDFYNAWETLIGYGEPYFEWHEGWYRFIGLEGDLFVSKDMEAAYNVMKKQVKLLAEYYNDLIEYVKTNYPQIDLDETSNKFRNDFKYP